MTQKWQVYDPRHGGDRRFTLRLDGTVSSLSNGFWILEAGNAVDWLRHAAILDEAFAGMGGQGYFTYLPWAPDVTARGDQFRSRFVDVDVVSPGTLLIARVDSGDGLVTRMLQEQSALGGRRSGLWSTGVAGSIANLQEGLRRIAEEADSPILASAANLSTIQGALCLDDGVDMVFLRLAAGIQGITEKLVAHI